LELGEPYTVGPKHRQTQVENHGDKGASGARGSPNAHSAGNMSSISGDSHVVAILGGWINVGTSTPTRLDYSKGGYSAWSNGSAFIYPDGTKQLLVYQPHIASAYQRSENGLLSATEFFGQDRLEIVENDNDILPGVAIGDQYSSHWYARWRSLLSRHE
jgi:hypothetical protein